MEFILYPSGGWIENEMKKQTKSDFKMTGAPEPVVSSNSRCLRGAALDCWRALHRPVAGQERRRRQGVLRAMLSQEAAVNFAKTKLASTIVKGTVPPDGFGLRHCNPRSRCSKRQGQTSLVELRRPLWHEHRSARGLERFLAGDSDVAKLTKGLQDITDKVAKDDSIKKVQVS